MDLLSMARTIWRLKLVTLPVIILTVACCAYVVAGKKPVYEAQSSFILINPPAPPTADEIARDPSLGKIKTDNPYTRSGDLSIVVAVLVRTVDGAPSRDALVRQGVDPRYKVAPDAQFGLSSAIVQVTGVGSSADGAVRSANMVGAAVIEQLDQIQKIQGTHWRYRIRPLQVDVPNQAQLRLSGQLRMLVGVIAVGMIVLFMVISVADALDTRRREQAASILEVPAAEAPSPRIPAADPRTDAPIRRLPLPIADPPEPPPEAMADRTDSRSIGRLRLGQHRARK